MKKKMFLLCVVSVSLIILFVLPANALFDNDVKKAKEFMTAGMYPQAIELLNKRINEKPTDAEAHFQLGVCYINTGNFSGADQRFGSAIKLNADYGYQIGEKYKKVGDEALNKGNTGQAKSLYQMAVQYQPDLKNGIVKETFSQGKGFFEKGKYDLADNVFSISTAFDASLSQEISNMYFNLGQSADAEQSIDLFRRAKRYSNSHNEEIGQKMVELAKADGVSSTNKKRYKEEAGRYLDKAEMKKAFPPDYKVYGRGTYTFSLKAGEKTDLWIQLPMGVLYSIKSADDKFKVLYYDGEIVPAWTPGNWPNKTKFKIIAISDQPEIKMVVK